MPTALKIINGALREIGVVATGEDAGGSEGDEALDILNDLVDALGVERLSMYSVLRTAKTLASGTASYSIGSGGSINIVRPNWIDGAMLVVDMTVSPSTEVPIAVLTEEEYKLWPTKALQSTQSQAIHFDHAWSAGLGLIYVLPIPNVATTQLVLYTPQTPVTQFADLNTTSYTFPPGIRRMLRKNLALELAPSYPAAVVTELLAKQAGDSKSAYKRGNVRALPLRCDDALVGGGGAWNINSGSYKR